MKNQKQVDTIAKQIRDILSTDADFQAACENRIRLADKIKSIEDGIASLESELVSIGASIEADRMMLGDDAGNAVEINRRIGASMMMVDSTRLSIEAMREKLLPNGDLMRSLEDAEGAVIVAFRRAQGLVFDEVQTKVTAAMDTAFSSCQAASAGAGEVLRGLGLVTIAKHTRGPHRLSMGSAVEYAPFLEFLFNPQQQPGVNLASKPAVAPKRQESAPFRVNSWGR